MSRRISPALAASGALAVLVAVTACGGRSQPAATPAPNASAPAPASACPAEGSPCTTPDAACGGDTCRDATGFCNIVVCKESVWTRVEVPPPPPSSAPPSGLP